MQKVTKTRMKSRVTARSPVSCDSYLHGLKVLRCEPKQGDLNYGESSIISTLCTVAVRSNYSFQNFE